MAKAGRGTKWRELDPTRLSTEARRLQASLESRVIGQGGPVEAVTKFHQIWLSGLNDPNRPVASFLFLGPTGTGKTRLVEALAETLFGDRRAMLKIDCAEFSHSHEIARLIGSPPGYLGHRDTPPFLSQENIDRYQTRAYPLTLLLFDEIEKANDALWMLLLGMLDKGRLTLGTNESVDMTRCVIFMTSNVGADQFDRLYDDPLGFQLVGEQPEPSTADLTDSVMEATRRVFSPEFLNRIDRRVVFNNLGSREYEKILDLELGYIRRRVQARLDLDLRCTPSARRYMLRRGTNPRYGARPLRNLLETEVLFPLASLISSDQVKDGDRVQIDATRKGERLAFKRAAMSMAASARAQSDQRRSAAKALEDTNLDDAIEPMDSADDESKSKGPSQPQSVA